MKYHIHIGSGIENAKEQSAICEFNHEFIAELADAIEKQPDLNIFLSNFDPHNRYLEISGEFGDLEKVKDNLGKLQVKKSIEPDIECFISACQKAYESNFHLYLIME